MKRCFFAERGPPEPPRSKRSEKGLLRIGKESRISFSCSLHPHQTIYLVHVTSHSHHKWSVGFCQSFWKIFVYDDLFGNGNLGWNPNFRCASSLLRGSSRICGPDCEPQRAFRGQPPQAALRPRSRHPPRHPLGLPCGRGVKGSIRLAPDQTDRRLRLPRVFSASAEARQAASPNGLRFLPFIRFYHESGCQSEPGGNFPPGFDISVRIGKSNSISKNGWLYTKRSLEKFQ